jgi:oligopeptide transport system permease protein
MISIFIVFALLYWVGMARLVRGQVLSLKGARIRFGGPFDRCFAEFHHPQTPDSEQHVGHHHLGGLEIPSAIFTESFLSFIGLGVSAPMPSLGLACERCRRRLTFELSVFDVHPRPLHLRYRSLPEPRSAMVSRCV